MYPGALALSGAQHTLIKVKKSLGSKIESRKGGNNLSVHQQMNKQNLVYTYSGILVSLEKKGSSDTCYNVNEPQRHYAK